MENKQSGLGIAAFIFGIVGLLFSCIVVGIVPAIVGLILGIVALGQKGKKRGLAIAGIICAVIGILVFTIFLAITNGNKSETQTETLNPTTQPQQDVNYDVEQSAEGSTEGTQTENQLEKPQTELEQDVLSKEEIISQCQDFKYKSIARNPDEYAGQYFKVEVKVATVENGGFLSGYDKAYKAYTNDEYDLWFGDMIYLLDNRDIKSADYLKILEDDIITVYGRFDGMVETKNHINNTRGEEVALEILYVDLIEE